MELNKETIERIAKDLEAAAGFLEGGKIVYGHQLLQAGRKKLEEIIPLLDGTGYAANSAPVVVKYAKLDKIELGIGYADGRQGKINVYIHPVKIECGAAFREAYIRLVGWNSSSEYQFLGIPILFNPSLKDHEARVLDRRGNWLSLDSYLMNLDGSQLKERENFERSY